ncbi:uracil-DNA glycosylase family protein [Alkanindiges hydrocarboniclasticus]|uniref:uracil-DNA glycosylase family protein n=1 Tax=Alkanindiges hydrocarboniclasticus TaxID=1907941 RepID=UPI0018E956DA|nr:uracil-DNA glycosylase family protein [Alkanindiges hydrocarboniclasticus]
MSQCSDRISTTDLSAIDSLLQDIRSCNQCADFLPQGTRPILQFNPQAKILIASQAPGRKAHDSGIPFNDASGDRLRHWLGLSRETFYDATQIAIVPMGFCYPGKGKSGDLPPRPECAATWHDQLLKALPNIELTILIGQYAQAYHLKAAHDSLTKNVMNWREFWPHVMPLPHPSPRNIFWLRRNPWFETEIIPGLQQRVAQVLD